MGRYANALSAAKTDLLTVTALKQVKVYPADYPFTVNDLPVAIVHRMTNREAPVRTRSVGSGSQTWQMGIDILLIEGPLMNDEQMATADGLYEPWVDTIDALLAGDYTLGGTVTTIGQIGQGVTFTPMDTHLQWYKKIYWGIRFQVPVLQDWDRTLAP